MNSSTNNAGEATTLAASGFVENSSLNNPIEQEASYYRSSANDQGSLEKIQDEEQEHLFSAKTTL